MFVQPRNRNMIEAAFATLALIYHQTVHNLRQSHSNAVVGLAMSILQSLAMVIGFVAMFYVLGVRRSPIRGDFMVKRCSLKTEAQGASSITPSNTADQACRRASASSGLAIASAA